MLEKKTLLSLTYQNWRAHSHLAPWLCLIKTQGDECLAVAMIIHSLFHSCRGPYQVLGWESGKVAARQDAMLSHSDQVGR